MNKVVAFKGVSDGVNIEILNDNVDLIKKSINNIMEKSGKFFKGAKLLGFTGKKIGRMDMLDITYMLKYKYGFKVNPENLILDMAKEHCIEKEVKRIKKDNEILIKEGITKYINGTIRSGQAESYKGNIVVLGDVNPGGVVKAGGNIIVLGSLRGTAYAGSNGNKSAVVAAYNLRPTQLKIGDIIVRAPDDEEIIYKVPEVAKVQESKVIIEPYLPNKESYLPNK